jgi:hypothetical protein
MSFLRPTSLLLPLLLVSCTTALSPVPEAWRSAPATKPIRSVAYGDFIRPSPEPRVLAAKGDVRVETTDAGQVLMKGTQALTPAFAAIDSFDVSLDRGEVAFSAKRDDDFDIGLVALEGSPIRWMPNDPNDEIGVQWAPRGHKISYIIRGKRADFVRTLHIPTAFEFTVDFQHARVHDLAWDAPAERFAVALEKIDASDHVEVMKYSGESRSVAVEPAVKLDVSLEPLGTAILLRPSALRYNERVPLVAWITDGDLNRWDDTRGALMRDARIGAVVMNAMPGHFWDEVEKLPWVDTGRIYVVDSVGTGFSPSQGGMKPAPTFITSDATIPFGSYKRQGQTLSVRPADVKSFAAAFIADQLKGTDVTRHR